LARAASGGIASGILIGALAGTLPCRSSLSNATHGGVADRI